MRWCSAGVQLKGGAVLAADLVIDASGRRSKVQKWLAEGGYSAPATVEVDPGVGYTTSIFDVPPEVRCWSIRNTKVYSRLGCACERWIR